MAEATAIEAATRRLTVALDALEAAVERRGDADRGDQSRGAQLQSLGADRSRLAAELDEATARAKEIETINREIARRIDVAMDGIRAVLEVQQR